MKIYFKYFIFLLIAGVISLTVGSLFFGANFETLKTFGKTFGTISVISYILTLIPGIFKRLNIKVKTTILMLARQQLGILMFVSGLAHYILSALKTIILPILAVGGIPKTLPFFVFGFLALLFALPMFLTSNNWIKSKMKKSWTRLHLVTHGLGWLIFGHIFLRNPFEILNLLLLVVMLADIWSLFYDKHSN